MFSFSLQMMPSADPSNPQYSMIPQLTTQMSTLHLGTGSVSKFQSFLTDNNNNKKKTIKIENILKINFITI